MAVANGYAQRGWCGVVYNMLDLMSRSLWCSMIYMARCLGWCWLNMLVNYRALNHMNNLLVRLGGVAVIATGHGVGGVQC